VDPRTLVATLGEAAVAIRRALETFEGSGLSGGRPTQYELDVVADEAGCAVLAAAGLAVFSEETGRQGTGDLLAVIDPVDGSTNFDRGIPFSCVSICVLDEVGPLVGLVESLTTGVRYEAVRAGGATRDGQAIATSAATSPSGCVVGVNGVLASRPPWAQTRTMGAAALEMCLVAEGALDAYVQARPAVLHPWDYLAALLIVQEAGGCVLEADGKELLVAEAVPRRPLVAATTELAEQLVACPALG
jgi:myo-inositol-1(or 4)-monophosphatase